jgi:hypothetical protein
MGGYKVNQFNCPFEIGDTVKPSGISHAPEMDAEMGLTKDIVGTIVDYSIVDGKVQMVCVLWDELELEAPHLLDEIVKVNP